MESESRKVARDDGGCTRVYNRSGALNVNYIVAVCNGSVIPVHAFSQHLAVDLLSAYSAPCHHSIRWRHHRPIDTNK